MTPEETNTETGVSVRYIQNPNRQWFVFRVTYGREQKASLLIGQQGIEVYLPMRPVYKQANGQRICKMESLMPNLLFVHCTKDEADALVKRTPELSTFLRYYYNHLQLTPDGKNPPLIIQESSMLNFIHTVNTANEHLKVVNTKNCHYKSDEKVRVIMGCFAGVEGKVARVAGQQRVIVEIDGLCAIATAYMPSAFLERIK